MGKLFPGHAARGGQLVIQERAGVEEPDPEGLDLLGDRAKDCLGVATLAGKQDLRRLEIGLAGRRRGAGGSTWPAMIA